MKKHVFALLAALMLCAGILGGCTTKLQSYGISSPRLTHKQRELYCEQVANGKKTYTKQDVYKKLGVPEGYCSEAEGFTETEDETHILFEDDVYRWVYSGYALPDPAEPYEAVFEFDENGNCVEASIGYIPGG